MEELSQAKVTAHTSEIETPTPSPKLEIRYGDKRGRDGQILSAATSTPIYNISHRYRKPTFTLKSAVDDHIIATACSSMWTMKMAMDVAGQRFDLTPKTKFGGNCTYASPAFSGQTLSWVSGSDGRYMTYVCLDEGERQIARFRGPKTVGCSMEGSFGEFELVSDGMGELSEAQRDELVATGLTLAYKAVMNKTAASASVVV